MKTIKRVARLGFLLSWVATLFAPTAALAQAPAVASGPADAPQVSLQAGPPAQGPTDVAPLALGPAELPSAPPPLLPPIAPPPQVRGAKVVELPPSEPRAPSPLAPVAAPLKPGVLGVPVRPYGIAWASGIAGQPVQSYGNLNSTAPTSAINPAVFAHAHDGTLTFQVQQTRAGVVVGEGSPVRATLEVDFLHLFDMSSPAQQATPRLRVALIEYQFAPTQKVFVGQTWDLFGNAGGPSLLSHSFNLVGTLFQAGNVGFMRHQIGWTGRFGDLELASAIGMQGTNTGPTYNDIEQAATPTGSARLMYHLPEKMGTIGVSGIGTQERFSPPSGSAIKAVHHRGAGGAQLFGDLTFGPLNLHAELYASQNLANTGALNLSQGRYDQNIQDAGGYVSGKATFGEHAFTAMYGIAAVLNPSKVAPGYTQTAMGAASGAVGTVNASAGPGMKSNMTAHVGYWFSPFKGLSFVAEPYVYTTKFAQQAPDIGRVKAKNTAWGGMLGSMYTF